MVLLSFLKWLAENWLLLVLDCGSQSEKVCPFLVEDKLLLQAVYLCGHKFGRGSRKLADEFDESPSLIKRSSFCLFVLCDVLVDLHSYPKLWAETACRKNKAADPETERRFFQSESGLSCCSSTWKRASSWDGSAV